MSECTGDLRRELAVTAITFSMASLLMYNWYIYLQLAYVVSARLKERFRWRLTALISSIIPPSFACFFCFCFYIDYGSFHKAC